MARAPQPPKPSTNGPSPVVLVVGGVIVVALLTFSLSRSMRKAPAATVADSAQSSMQPAVSTAGGVQQGESASPLPPMASPQAGAAAAPVQTQLDETGGATPAQVAAVPRTNPVDLLQKLESKQVTVIDVRDADSYQARHIPGALHIPLAYIAGEVSYLPKDKPIVTYCTWPAEESSAGAALKLEQAGIRNVSALQGGLDEWERNGYPIERGIPKQ